MTWSGQWASFLGIRFGVSNPSQNIWALAIPPHLLKHSITSWVNTSTCPYPPTFAPSSISMLVSNFSCIRSASFGTARVMLHYCRNLRPCWMHSMLQRWSLLGHQNITKTSLDSSVMSVAFDLHQVLGMPLSQAYSICNVIPPKKTLQTLAFSITTPSPCPLQMVSSAQNMQLPLLTTCLIECMLHKQHVWSHVHN